MKNMSTTLVLGGIIAALLAAKGTKKISGIGLVGELDRDAVRELLLWYKNTSDLYFRFTVPLAENLVKKLKRGQELSEEYFANSSVIDNVVRETIRDYQRAFGNFYISTATRKELKKEIAHSILQTAYDNYDFELNNVE